MTVFDDSLDDSSEMSTMEIIVFFLLLYNRQVQVSTVEELPLSGLMDRIQSMKTSLAKEIKNGEELNEERKDTTFRFDCNYPGPANKKMKLSLAQWVADCPLARAAYQGYIEGKEEKYVSARGGLTAAGMCREGSSSSFSPPPSILLSLRAVQVLCNHRRGGGGRPKFYF
jgi:hypothetical protein